MTVLLVAELDAKGLNAATASTLTAATQIGGDVHILVAGGAKASAAADAAAKLSGAKKVLLAEDAAYENAIAENIAKLVASVAKDYSHILAPATTFGKDFLPRVAATLDVQQISEITKVVSADTFLRPIYAGNALATVQSSDKIKVMTVRPSAFARAKEGGAAQVEKISGAGDAGLSKFVSIQVSQSDRPDLGSARIVVSGGRGVGSKENFQIIEKLAAKLGAAVGASRAAVDAGYISNDYQVGQTGKSVAPDLYMAIGISGAIQHLAGMLSSKVIVAINKDETAPIFEIADYGLVGDLFEIIPQLEQKLG